MQSTVCNNLRDTFTFLQWPGLLMIVSFLTVADWSIRHRINLKVSRRFLRTVAHVGPNLIPGPAQEYTLPD